MEAPIYNTAEMAMINTAPYWGSLKDVNLWRRSIRAINIWEIKRSQILFIFAKVDA